MRSESRTSAAVETGRTIVVRRILLVFFLLSLIGGGLVLPFPMDGRLWGEIFDLAHAPVFFSTLICLVGIPDPVAIGLSRRFATVWSMNTTRVLTCAGLLMTLGMICEYLQQFADRSPSWNDIASNAIGIVAALLWIQSRPLGQGLLRRAMILTSVLLLAIVSTPPLLQIQDCIQQIRGFPVLASFERPRELGSWKRQSCRVKLSRDWASHGKQSLRVDMRPGRYPGVSMYWFPQPWTGYKSLRLEISNPNAEPLDLILKIHDRQHWQNNFTDDDRFHQHLQVPGNAQREVIVNLADVAEAPASRKMNLSDITSLEIFSVDVESPTTWYLDHVRLEE